MKFIRSANDPRNSEVQAYYFCFLDDNVLLEKNDQQQSVPLLTSFDAEEFKFNDKYFIGFLNDRPCYTAAKVDSNITDAYQWINLKDLYLNDDSPISDIAGFAKQILTFNRNFRFCGRCGLETYLLANEHARGCEKCQLINYPRLSPAIITAVIKEDQILLARSHKFNDKQMFSVLAGFLEPGESLEQCVKREVFEEVGIEVTNIKYFKSQSWPFPDSLMIGFTADYKSGDIKIDGKEIAEAGWFKVDALPKVPTRRSISSELIRWFVEK